LNWKTEYKKLLLIIVVFLACFYLPVGSQRFDNAISESLELVKDYARLHVLLCLVPAFFIAGAIGVFLSQGAVMKYLGPKANKFVAYGVASVSGTVLAVCSCTVLPLFAGIYRMGAGLGPAVAFLYAGPAINILSIVLTARILGVELGIARAVGAVVFSVVVGFSMHLIYRKEELQKSAAAMVMPEDDKQRPLYQTAIYFAIMVAILVFANWAKPADAANPDGIWANIFAAKWHITAILSIAFAVVLIKWLKLSWLKIVTAVIAVTALALLWSEQPIIAFSAGIVALSVITSTDKGPAGHWFQASWTFAKQILPLLFFGVLIAGFLLGRPGYEGIIPAGWVENAVGGNSIRANLFASVAGAFMYFATLTEVPILKGLIGAGMGKGPALALLLAGPALSLPNMLVIRSVMGTQKTIVYVSLVVVVATISGIIFGAIVI
jgi:uncharacterized membrane protein YraQ (UPF0718 family)